MPLRHTSFLWQMYTKFREEYMEARSAQLLLGDVADAATGAAAAPKAEGAADAAGQAAGGAAGGALAAVRALTPRGAGAGRVGLSSGTDPITGDTCARIELTAHGHDFGVQIFVPPSAVGDGIRKRWIRAETVIQAQVDYFADGTGGLGQALSPTVCVDIEPTSSGTPTSLAGDYTAVFPLCIGSCMDDRSEIAKGDLALCFGRWQTGEWLEIEESNFELLPPRKMDRYGCEMPFCAVRLPRAGLVCAFSRHDNRKPRMRVRCAAYLPGRMSHLELHRLRVYVCHAIPDELESLTVREQHDRGSVLRCGLSDVFELSYGERLSISVRLKSAGGKAASAASGGAAAASVPVGVVAGGAESVNWMGDVTYVDFDFDPEGVVGLAKGGDKGGGDGDGDGGGDGDGDGGGDGDGDGGGAAALSAPVDIIGELEVNVEVEDLKARLRAAGKRRGGGAFGGIGLSGGSGGRGEGGEKDSARTHAFSCAVAVQEFPRPAPPTGLTLVHRTNASIAAFFEPPRRWGGCALDRHEVEIREIGKDGKYHEKGWEHAQDIAAGRQCVTQIARRVWMAEIRVRTWNIACEHPSDWSDVLAIGEPKDGGKGPGQLDRSGKSKTDVVAAAKANEAMQLKKARSSIEGGVAMLVQADDLERHFNVKHVLLGEEHMATQKWSPLRTAVGNFYEEVGVFDGCEGRLFDFGSDDVEDIVTLGDDPNLDPAKPLFSLAMLACYALQTLAQHAEVETSTWVDAANDAAMLVRLASGARETDETRPMVRSLLTGLVDMYETLTQCESDGYIARQLNAKYEKGLKQLLRNDFAEQLARLKNRLASDVMGLVLYERLQAHTR